MPDLQVCGCRGCVPIMDVDDIGFETNVHTDLQTGSGKKGKSPWVIQVIIKFSIMVNTIASKIILVLDKINWDPIWIISPMERHHS